MTHKKYVLAGDSWAWKAYTQENFDKKFLLETDQRLSDFWDLNYETCITPGLGNLDILNRLLALNLDPGISIIWIYTEPGRDYGRVTGQSEFGWIESEHIFEIRQDLNKQILKSIRETLPNSIGLIGGLSDIDIDLAKALGFDILQQSWQRWIAEKMDSRWFQFGWGASDIGWRMHANDIKPSRAATFAWDEQIKEWCWWQDHGWFCHEHPTLLAHREFASFLKPSIVEWLIST